MLVRSHHIGQDQAEAVTAAEDAALNYMPDYYSGTRGPGDAPARHAFLAQDGAWAVLVKQRHRECHFRVTTARLMYSHDEREASPNSPKEKFRSALDARRLL